MSDLLGRIRTAQRDAGEAAVCAHLAELGLIPKEQENRAERAPHDWADAQRAERGAERYASQRIAALAATNPPGVDAFGWDRLNTIIASAFEDGWKAAGK